MPDVSSTHTSRARNGRKTGAQLVSSRIPADVMAHRRDRIAEITGNTNTAEVKPDGSTDTSTDGNQPPEPCAKCGWYCANRADCRELRKMIARERAAAPNTEAAQ